MTEEDSIEWNELSDIFELLANERCLYTLLCLQRTEEPISVQELAAETAAKEADIPREDVSEQQVTRVSQSLHHTHLPRLQEMKIIEYKSGTDHITISCDFWKVETIIDAVADGYPHLSAENRA